MWRIRCFIAGLAGAVLASSAFAGEIPAPVKKPRDHTGAVITKPSQNSVDVTGHHTQPESETKSAKPAPASDVSKAVPAEVTKPVPGEVAKPVPAADTKPEPATDKKAAPAAGAKAAATPAAVPPIPKEWSPEDIQIAKAHCNTVLAGVDAVTVPEPAFRDGECGAPAAVRLVSIGKNPQVAFDPPPLLTCDMVSALHIWMKQDVQPLAKKHLGSEVIKIETMSDYSCRNAYGRIGGKLSEHGHANALDIRGFVTAQAKTAYVLEQWGPVQREIAAQVAAAKAAAEKTEAEKAAANAANVQSAQSAAGPPASTGLPGKGTLIEGLPKLSVGRAAPGATSLGFDAARLGGPKDKDKSKVKGAQAAQPAGAIPVQAGAAGGPTAIFLHAAHAAACRIFGTTLGPEANKDHVNHFHVDMAPRKTTKICD